jgi:hypothetical protein
MPVLMTAFFFMAAFSTRVMSRSDSATMMVEAANRFLDSLTPEQQEKVMLEFDNPARLSWDFLPVAMVGRAGILIKELDQNQRKLAHEFLKTGLSQRGYLKVTTIIELEILLRELEGSAMRDPELYSFAIFGKPSTTDHWGWRVEGHHLSLNFTVVSDTMVATAPRFLGSNPAEVKQGLRQGLRVLASEEDIARELIKSMDEKQREAAIFKTQAFPDIVTDRAIKVSPLPPAGILAGQLNQQQMNLLIKLLDEYISTMPAELATERMEKLRGAGLEEIRFGWAGGIERGQPHYYRIQGPTFLVEYDNIRNNANHIHTVWRDFDGDFGRDLLQEHYRNIHHQH